jgi:hypothetical protein
MAAELVAETFREFVLRGLPNVLFLTPNMNPFDGPPGSPLDFEMFR